MPVWPAPQLYRANFAGDRLWQFHAQRTGQRPGASATTGAPAGAQCAVPDTAANLQPEINILNDARLEALSPQRRGRVLLVEDNPVNQLVAKGMLGKLGCEVIVAAHGGEALDQLEHSEFDLVLMDCNMPVMDGYEASRQIRRSGRWPQLPIVALTANAMSEERERCRAAGMSDYLAKPFRREELAALLDLWMPTTTVT